MIKRSQGATRFGGRCRDLKSSRASKESGWFVANRMARPVAGPYKPPESGSPAATMTNVLADRPRATSALRSDARAGCSGLVAGPCRLRLCRAASVGDIELALLFGANGRHAVQRALITAVVGKAGARFQTGDVPLAQSVGVFPQGEDRQLLDIVTQTDAQITGCVMQHP
jgi:hypothetical protein